MPFIADIGVTDEFGRTPLHNAILGKQLGIVEMLLNKGADVQAQDERKDTHSVITAPFFSGEES